MLVIAVGICIASYGGASRAARCAATTAQRVLCCRGRWPPTTANLHPLASLSHIPRLAPPCAGLNLRRNLCAAAASHHFPCPCSPHPCPPEINFVLVGVMLQMASVATESTRLTLVQILLQARGVGWRCVVGLLLGGATPGLGCSA